MEQIKRIQHFEEILDGAEALLKTFSEMLDRYREIQAKIKELSDYYGSKDWLRDYEDDRAGKLPAGLKRGVLSEDGIYNVLEDNKALMSQMQQTANNDHNTQASEP